MHLKVAAQHMQGKLVGEDAVFFGAATDTRQLQAGQLFFAWKGAQVDAHDFLEHAASKGAVAAVVERIVPQVNLPQIVVAHAQQALLALAAAWRQNWQGCLVAVTGSNGKTTLKEMLKSIFSQVDKTWATTGNFNNHVGCPLTLLQLRPEHQYAVIEMGANHPHELSVLTQAVRPLIAVINNVGACHLQGFGSMQGIADAKAEIFEGLPTQGIAVLNADDNYCQQWLAAQRNAGHQTVSFGSDKQADVRYVAQASANTFSLHLAGEQEQVTLQLEGEHNMRNATAAAAVAHAAGVSLALIKSGLEQVVPVAGRLQRLSHISGATLIHDAYNANPTSLGAALTTFKTGYRWLVLGDMRELGEQAAHLHYGCGEQAKALGFERLYGLGELSQHACEGFGQGAQHFDSHAQLIARLREDLALYTEQQTAPTVLVKGSFSMNMNRIIDGLQCTELKKDVS